MRPADIRAMRDQLKQGREYVVSFVARKYRYNDGVAYQDGRYTIYLIEDGQAVRGVGGMLKAENKFLAFAGPSGEGHSVKSAQRYPHAWGYTARVALTNLKPSLLSRLAT